MSVRVRFAPAPSGELHVGGARTALFNWLFARHHGGTLVLRIEDTDPATAKPEFIEPIYEAMRWLGLGWDEGPDVGGPYGPYRQSERRDVHLAWLRRLEEGGHVYRCYCTREDVKARGVKTGYDRHCRSLSEEDRKASEDAGRPYALRFAVPEGEPVVVDDLLRGEVRTEFEDMQDFVVARSDGSPTFVLANAADDAEMEITHAIRGVDLLSAASQTTLISRALEREPPRYAHIPLILAPDKAKLSKRHGAVSVGAFREEGYLPEAMVNYLALLGWSPGTDEEFFPLDDLVESFDLDAVQSSPAIFDRVKLTWLNQEHLKTLSTEEFETRVLELAPDIPKETLRTVLDKELVQTRVKTLAEVPEAIRYLYERPEIDEKSRDKWLGTEEANRTLERVAELLESHEPWTSETIKDAIQGLIADLGLHKRKGPKPIFVAISGSEVALPLFESIEMIGREEAVARLRAAVA